MTTLRLYIYGIGASVVPGRSIHFNIDINDERNLIGIKTLAENPGANPRTSDLASSVARAIENSLASNPSCSHSIAPRWDFPIPPAD